MDCKYCKANTECMEIVAPRSAMCLINRMRYGGTHAEEEQRRAADGNSGEPSVCCNCKTSGKCLAGVMPGSPMCIINRFRNGEIHAEAGRVSGGGY